MGATAFTFFIGTALGLIQSLWSTPKFSPLGSALTIAVWGSGGNLLFAVFLAWRSSGLRAELGPLPWWAVHKEDTRKTFR